jgi:hypothetical protein
MAIIVSKVMSSGFISTYARPISGLSMHLDSGVFDLQVALYKDAEARFAGAEPAGYDFCPLQLNDEERAAVAKVLYMALERQGYYKEGTVRDPDPEKTISE